MPARPKLELEREQREAADFAELFLEVSIQQGIRKSRKIMRKLTTAGGF